MVWNNRYQYSEENLLIVIGMDVTGYSGLVHCSINLGGRDGPWVESQVFSEVVPGVQSLRTTDLKYGWSQYMQ